MLKKKKKKNPPALLYIALSQYNIFLFLFFMALRALCAREDYAFQKLFVTYSTSQNPLTFPFICSTKDSQKQKQNTKNKTKQNKQKQKQKNKKKKQKTNKIKAKDKKIKQINRIKHAFSFQKNTAEMLVMSASLHKILKI